METMEIVESEKKGLTRRQINAKIAREAEVDEKDVARVMDALEQLVVEELQRAQSFKLGNLGSFKIAEVKERTGFNPKTKAKQTIPAHITPKFNFTKQIKGALENAMNPHTKLKNGIKDLNE